jgi:hypothetical protein
MTTTLTTIVINESGSIACVTDINNDIWIVYTDGSVPPTTVTGGPFQKKSQYTVMETIAVSVDGKTAYVFHGSDLYVIDTDSSSPSFATASLFSNFGSDTIHSVALFSGSPTPPPPSLNNVSGVSLKQFDSWQADIYEVISWSSPFTPDHFNILRNGVQIATVPGIQHTYQDNYLPPETTYRYSVVAVAGDGTPTNLGTVTLTTQKD